MYCPNCGTPNADEARFCVNCGRPLTPMAAPPPPTPPPAYPSYPAYPAPPAAIPRPAGAADSIRLLGLITLGLSVLVIVGFFLMNWSGGGTGWDLFYQTVLRDIGSYFDDLGRVFRAVTEGDLPWTFALGITTGLLWLVPLSALVTGLYGLFSIAVPQNMYRIRAMILIILVALIVLGALLGFVIANVGLEVLEYGFWVTLVGSGVLFLVGLFGVAALVPLPQR